VEIWTFQKFDFFVLDEADKLISEQNFIMTLYQQLPKGKSLQVMMFSATLHSPEVKTLAEKICRFPIWVDLKGKDYVPETVHHTMVWADPTKEKPVKNMAIRTDEIHKKDRMNPGSAEYNSEMIKILKYGVLERVIQAYSMNQALIFVRTKVDADNLEYFFNQISNQTGPVEAEYSCSVLHGGRSVQERQANLQKFKDGEVRFFICTDVAARGIDIKELPYVINFTLPDKPEDYIHRVGRVGRADNMGLAVSIVATQKEKVWYHQCPKKGINCWNTNLVSEGGCAIWYDEPTYLKQIEERIGSPISVHEDDSKKVNIPVVYGQRRTEGATALFEDHVAKIKPDVVALFQLEDDVQKTFWKHIAQWKNIAKVR